MVFNSINFLFLFLPVFIIIYLLADKRYKNIVALVSSIIFISWGQIQYIPLCIFIIILNFYLAKYIENQHKYSTRDKALQLLILGCTINIILLLFFKAYFVYGEEWSWLPAIITNQIKQDPIPLGLSYITFQVISYLVDVYNERCASEKNLINFSLYVLLFPKILVGPITRYRDLAGSLINREENSYQIASGIRRFILGLAKKVLIADTLAVAINPAFSLNKPIFSTGIAWFVLFAYAIQLYFDFSGYTDMAIGIGQIMGFKFMENFNYPYISKSISEFWRRWHISLSSWFRDIVFYPLERLRHKSKYFNQSLNILIVFLLTGLWHGLTINYLIWGGIHGLAIIFEIKFKKMLDATWAPLLHIYTLIVILCSWVFFRAKSLDYAFRFFGRLFGSQEGLATLQYSATKPLPIIDNSVWIALALGVIFSLPVLQFLRKRWSLFSENRPSIRVAGQLWIDGFLFIIGVLSIASITNLGISASIYGGF